MHERGWRDDLRRIHDESFHGTDWPAAVREANLRLGGSASEPFSLVVPGGPPPLFNGDTEKIQPRKWALIVSLNHQLGDHVVSVEPDTLWDYWRNYNRKHWYSRFSRPLALLACSALGEPEPADLPEWTAAHVVFVELCPYASESFRLSREQLADPSHIDPGFRFAARVNRLLIDAADPAVVLVNGSAACSAIEAEFTSALTWAYREYVSPTPKSSGEPKRLWHYEGVLRSTLREVPIVGFPFLRTRSTHNSNDELAELAKTVRENVRNSRF